MTPETITGLLTNVGFPTGLLILSYFAIRAMAAFLRPWLEKIFTRVVSWFDAQTELVRRLKESIDATAANVEHISRTQEILVRGQQRANRIFDRVVGVMEHSPCVSPEMVKEARRDYDSDDMSDVGEDSSGDSKA